MVWVGLRIERSNAATATATAAAGLQSPLADLGFGPDFRGELPST